MGACGGGLARSKNPCGLGLSSFCDVGIIFERDIFFMPWGNAVYKNPVWDHYVTTKIEITKNKYKIISILYNTHHYIVFSFSFSLL